MEPIWGFACGLGFVIGWWLSEAFGERVRDWLVSVIELPKKL